LEIGVYTTSQTGGATMQVKAVKSLKSFAEATS